MSCHCTSLTGWVVLMALFGASACSEPQCPDGFMKVRNICKRLDAGAAEGDADMAAPQLDAAAPDADASDVTRMDGATLATPDGATGTKFDADIPRDDASTSEAGAIGDASGGEHDASAIDAGSDAVVSCGAGHIIKAGVCEDVDECFAGTHTCHVSAACNNTDGSYDCACPLGYSGGTKAGFACAPRIVVGDSFACALQSDGRVKCWGRNTHGELGDGTQLLRLAPVFVKGLDRVVAIAAHDSTSVCALRDDGRVACWGDNSSEQLGDGSPSRSEARTIVALSDVISLSVGTTQACAVTRKGDLQCWGSPPRPSVGGATRSPVTIAGIPPMVTTAVGWGGGVCAVTRVGALWCWAESMTSPAQIRGVSDVVHASVSIYPAVLRSNARVEAWTDADPTTTERAFYDGAISVSAGAEYLHVVLQDGSVHIWEHPPEAAGRDRLRVSITDAVVVAVGGLGSFSACAVVRDGTVRCWGVGNADGQLGDGTTNYPPAPSLDVFGTSTVSGLDLW